MSTKTSTSPLTVTAVVYSAKGLKPKKKDKHKFSVIVGVGASKYRTDVVEDLFDNPVFNTECDIDVDDVTLPLSFLVTEKHDRDILGQVTVPLSDLTSFRTNRTLRLPLQPHKKCPHAVGDLLFEAWISAGNVPTHLHQQLVATTTAASRDDDDRVLPTLPAGLRKLKDRLTSQQSPTLSRKSSASKGHKRNSSDGTLQLATSASLQDLAALESTSTTSTATRTESPRRSSAAVIATDLELWTVNKPEVTGVSPKEGSTEGGTRLTIRGSYLGRDKDDVVGLFVCGSNVLSSLEFISSSKLVCTTKPHKASTGAVTVETQTGGRGLSLVQFTFIDSTPPPPAVPSSSTSLPASAVPISAAVPVPSLSSYSAVPVPSSTSYSAVPVSLTEVNSDSMSECSSSLSRSSSRGDADIKRQPSVKSEGGAGAPMSSTVKPALKARSMFDLSLPQVLSAKSHHQQTPPGHVTAQQTPPTHVTAQPSHVTAGRPEVSGVSPREGPTSSETRLVVRGSHLGQSASDVIGLTVAGHDCLASLDYDSPSRITCLVGPAHAGPTVGDVIVETRSGGLGISLVQFRFVDTGVVDEDQFSAVPYDAGESRQTGPASLLRMTSSPPAAADAAESGSVSSSSSAVNQRVRTGPPPVVEIQPMMSTLRHTSTHGKPPAPPPPADDQQQSTGDMSSPRPGETDTWLSEKITELSSSLAASNELVRKLQHENKLLRDENERMRQYMECLVSKAIASCPQILCSDASKLF